MKNLVGGKYEILEHKADLKIRAFGKTKQELFSKFRRIFLVK